MAYNATIPKPTDALQDSQGDILDNFAAIKLFVDVDHKTFGDANQGAHAKVTLPDFAAAATFTGTNAGIYAQTSTLTTKNELYSHVTGRTDVPFTASYGDETATQGWAYLPSGILLKWGRASKTGLAQSVLFEKNVGVIPEFTKIYNVQVTTNDPGNVFAWIQSYTAIGFTVNCAERTTTTASLCRFDYLAIGR